MCAYIQTTPQCPFACLSPLIAITMPTEIMPQHRHPAAGRFLSLFDGVTSFIEFESKIVALPESHDKGAAFEVFVWAYLATSPIRQAKEVWPRTDMLSEAMRAGRYPSGDKGVDGVFVTHDGLECAYQAKFHGDRSHLLTWNGDKMSNFIGHRGKADKLVLITNVDDDNIDDEFKGDDFYAIRGRDFDELEARDFEAMRQYIVDGKIEYKRKTPHPYQKETIADVHGALATGDRATAVMACGTGKTLSALWIAERQVPTTGNVLVMVPTLALMRQNLHEWLGNTNWGSSASEAAPSFLTVCSDDGVGRLDHGRDDDGMQQSIVDMDFSPARGQEEVRQFLDKPSAGVKVIISTYQSLNVVQDAIRAGNDPAFAFDFAFFDEAHKTAGHSEKTMSVALQDVGIPIRKRLFMTATPRHYKLKSNPEDEEQLVFSMDDSAVYGPIAHNLSFRKAADKGIIAPYKVIISVIEEDPVPISREVLNSKDVAVKRDGKEDRVNARQVGLQLAIKQAADAHGLKRIITFHGETKHASQFVNKSVAGIGGHLDDFKTYHVNGTMPMGRRTQTMRAFREAERSLISNARCLTEGVDVPSVDMVVFTHNKRSTVDIVQAVGRAMRKSSGKDVGYVMVPVFLQPGEDIEEAVKSGRFDAVWEVLKSMSEHDETLADIIREMTVEKGKGTRTWSGEERLNSLMEIQYTGRVLKIEDLRRTIGTQIVEKLGENWDEMYGYLVQEKAVGREINVAWNTLTPDRLKIGIWLSNQRKRYNQDALSPERAAKLEALGVIWQRFAERWNRMYEYLAQEKAEGRDVNVANRTLTSNDRAVGQWLQQQRHFYKNGSLSPARIVKLERLGVVWDQKETKWDAMCAFLVQEKAAGREINVAWNTITPDGQLIGAWLNNQRQAYRKGALSSERIAKLERLGVVWSQLDAQWDEMYAYLVQEKAAGRDVNMETKTLTSDGLAIGSWLNTQRQNCKNMTLSPERVAKLEKLGVRLKTVVKIKSQWEAMHAFLTQEKAEGREVNVATKALTPNGLAIGLWLNDQRTYYKKGILPPKRVVNLEALGVVWFQWDENWDQMYSYLVQEKAAGREVNVATKALTPDGGKIGTWLVYQRGKYLKGVLSSERTEKLEALGVTWQVFEDRWNATYAFLEQEKAAGRELDVVSKALTPDGLVIERWINAQRAHYTKGILSPERIAKLEAIGVVWNPLKEKWPKMYRYLAQEYAAGREVNVATKALTPEGLKIGSWLVQQRTDYRKGSLSSERISQLEAIGVRLSSSD
jgi:superfamily II DNA or RNA helicase